MTVFFIGAGPGAPDLITIGAGASLGSKLKSANARDEGNEFIVEYFDEAYPVVVQGVGYKPLYDPENLKPRS